MSSSAKSISSKKRGRRNNNNGNGSENEHIISKKQGQFPQRLKKRSRHCTIEELQKEQEVLAEIKEFIKKQVKQEVEKAKTENSLNIFGNLSMSSHHNNSKHDKPTKMNTGGFRKTNKTKKQKKLKQYKN